MYYAKFERSGGAIQIDVADCSVFVVSEQRGKHLTTEIRFNTCRI